MKKYLYVVQELDQTRDALPEVTVFENQEAAINYYQDLTAKLRNRFNYSSKMANGENQAEMFYANQHDDSSLQYLVMLLRKELHS
ncbi:hypothetical protein [Limosilactobacillus sp.]|uniref:hypothetical protein n=1 Tax=Limosilactobacillus sp. TaxID=2773925 RepID=UPI0035A00C58